MFIGLYNIQHRSLGRDARRNLFEVIHVSGGVIYYIELLVSGAQKHKPPPPKRQIAQRHIADTYLYVHTCVNQVFRPGWRGRGQCFI